MKIFQSTSSTLLLLLATVALAPAANAVATPALTRPSVSSPSPQLISQAGIMSLGGSGPLVSQLQSDLATLGYFSGPNTGYFGSVTQDAVIRFQGDVGLTADGAVGPATSEAIQQRIGGGGVPRRPPSGNVLRRGDSGPQVVELQNLLQRFGYFSGPATGYFGSVTEDAVLALQYAVGITEDGIAGPAVYAAMGQ